MRRTRVILILFSGFFSNFFSPGFELAAQAAKSATPAPAGKTRVVYPENQTVDFEGLSLDGELKAPGEFYFQNRNQDRFDTLTKKRLNFRREMLRDAVQSN